MYASPRSLGATGQLAYGKPIRRRRQCRSHRGSRSPKSTRSSKTRSDRCRSESLCNDICSTVCCKTDKCPPYPMVMCSMSPRCRSKSECKEKKPWDSSTKIDHIEDRCPCRRGKRKNRKLGNRCEPRCKIDCCWPKCCGPCCLPIPSLDKKTCYLPTSCSPCCIKTEDQRLAEIFAKYNLCEACPCNCVVRQSSAPICVPYKPCVSPTCCRRAKRCSSINPCGFSSCGNSTYSCNSEHPEKTKHTGFQSHQLLSNSSPKTMVKHVPVSDQYFDHVRLNRTYSSNAGESTQQDQICSRCKAKIEFNPAKSFKECHCEFTLAPHCIRRKGPRSTVTEYLSTIDPPKPRPRLNPYGTSVPTPSLATSGAQGTAANAASGATSPRNKTSLSSGGSSTTSLKGSKKVKNKGISTPAPVAREDSTVPDETVAVAAGSENENGIKAEPKRVDSNNNNGMDYTANSSNHPTSTGTVITSTTTTRHVEQTEHTSAASVPRQGSVPNQRFISSLDSGYTRHSSVPYYYSSGLSMPLTYGYGVSNYSSTGGVSPYYRPSSGYFNEAQDYRKGIREYYNNKLQSYGSPNKRYNSNVNINAGQNASQYQHSSFPLYSSLNPMPTSKPKPPSPDGKKRANVPNFIEENRINAVRPKSPMKNNKEPDMLVFKGSPKAKPKIPLYTPRKSFVGENKSVDKMFQENWKMNHPANAIPNQLTNLDETGPVEQGGFKTHTQENQILAATEETSVSLKPLIMAPTAKTLGGELQTVKHLNECESGVDNETVIGNLQSQDMSEGVESEIDDAKEFNEQIKESSVDTYEQLNKLQIEKERLDLELKLNQEMIKKQQPWSSSIRKIEPSGTLLKAIVAEEVVPPVVPQSEATYMPLTSATIPVETSNAIDPSLIISSNVDVPDDHITRSEPIHQDSEIKTIPPNPVLQGLVQRFNDTVQILVGTKNNTNRAHYKSDASTGAINAESIAQPDESQTKLTHTMKNPNSLSEDGRDISCAENGNGEIIGPCDADEVVADNKSRNHVTMIGCDATSECVSWTELVNVSPKPHQLTTNDPPTTLDGINLKPSMILKHEQPKENVNIMDTANDSTQGGHSVHKLNTTVKHVNVSKVETLQESKKAQMLNELSLKLASQGEAKQTGSRLSCSGDDHDIKTVLMNHNQETSVDPVGRNNTTFIVNTVTQATAGEQLGQGENHIRLQTNKPLKIQSDTAVKSTRSLFWPLSKLQLTCARGRNGTSVDPEKDNPIKAASVLDIIQGKHPMFQKVNNSSGGNFIMAAKSKILNRVKGDEYNSSSSSSALPTGNTGITCSKATLEEMGGPFAGMVCNNANGSKHNSLTNTCSKATLEEMGGPFAGMVCNNANGPIKHMLQEEMAPIKIGSLTEVMKKFISDNGTPV